MRSSNVLPLLARHPLRASAIVPAPEIAVGFHLNGSVVYSYLMVAQSDKPHRPWAHALSKQDVPGILPSSVDAL